MSCSTKTKQNKKRMSCHLELFIQQISMWTFSTPCSEHDLYSPSWRLQQPTAAATRQHTATAGPWRSTNLHPRPYNDKWNMYSKSDDNATYITGYAEVSLHHLYTDLHVSRHRHLYVKTSLCSDISVCLDIIIPFQDRSMFLICLRVSGPTPCVQCVWTTQCFQTSPCVQMSPSFQTCPGVQPCAQDRRLAGLWPGAAGWAGRRCGSRCRRCPCGTADWARPAPPWYAARCGRRRTSRGPSPHRLRFLKPTGSRRRPHPCRSRLLFVGLAARLLRPPSGQQRRPLPAACPEPLQRRPPPPSPPPLHRQFPPARRRRRRRRPADTRPQRRWWSPCRPTPRWPPWGGSRCPADWQ